MKERIKHPQMVLIKTSRNDTKLQMVVHALSVLLELAHQSNKHTQVKKKTYIHAENIHMLAHEAGQLLALQQRK